MVSSTIGFVRRFRLRLSIAKRHSANVELQIAKCKMKRANIKNVERLRKKDDERPQCHNLTF